MEGKGLAAVDAGVELGAVEKPAGVVHVDRHAGLGLGTLADLESPGARDRRRSSSTRVQRRPAFAVGEAKARPASGRAPEAMPAIPASGAAERQAHDWIPWMERGDVGPAGGGEIAGAIDLPARLDHGAHRVDPVMIGKMEEVWGLEQHDIGPLSRLERADLRRRARGCRPGFRVTAVSASSIVMPSSKTASWAMVGNDSV